MAPTVKDLCPSCGRVGHHNYHCAHHVYREMPEEMLNYALSNPRCVSCGSRVSHYSHCAFFRGTSAETKFTLADRALLEHHAAQLFSMSQPVSAAVIAECQAEMERGAQNGWRCTS